MWLVLLMITHISTASQDVYLVPPATHTALSSDLEVRIISESFFSLRQYTASSLWVEAISADGDPIVMASVQIHGNPIPTKAVFKCGLLDVAGRYCFQLIRKFSNGSTTLLAESPIMQLKWPLLNVQIPPSIDTYTANISARLEVQGVVCYPPHSRVHTWLELVYFGQTLKASPLSSIFIQSLIDFYQVLSRDVIIPCQFLDRPGIYRITVQADQGTPKQITQSNVLKVTWSDLYDLNVQQVSIFPCHDHGIQVYYRHPKCILDRDKIRVFGRPRPSISAAGAAPPPLYYLGELTVDPRGGKLDFPCRFFPLRFVAFCFEYVSTSRSGAVANLKIKCVPSYFSAESSHNGEWGSWSEWSLCTASCGVNVTRTRHRFCDSPPTTHGGVFCPGSAIQVDHCQLSPCPVPPTTQSPIELSPVSERCRCGCKMNISGGAFVAASSHHCHINSVWLLKVQPGHRLRLTFDYLHLETGDQFVSARDGEFLSSQMLLSISGPRNSSSPVISTSNSILLEFHPSNRSNVTTGFVMHIQEILGAGMVITPKLLLSTSPSIFRSSVHWVSVSLCLFAAACALLLAAIYAIRRGRWIATNRYSSAESVGSQYQSFPALTSTTSISELSLVVKRRPKRKGRGRRLKRRLTQLTPVSSDGETYCIVESPGSPEDIMRDAGSMFLGSRDDVTCLPVKSPPLARRAKRQVELTIQTPNKVLPVATVSPQPQLKKSDSREQRRRSRHLKEEKKRESARNIKSPSVASLAPTEAEMELEYDYYDYDVHDDPGSYFSIDPGMLSWLPPFLPQLWSDEVVMNDLNNLPPIRRKSDAENEEMTTELNREPSMRNLNEITSLPREVERNIETEICTNGLDLNGIEFADETDSETESPIQHVKR